MSAETVPVRAANKAVTVVPIFAPNVKGNIYSKSASLSGKLKGNVNSDKIKINIYTSSGFLIDTIIDNQVNNNEYNEIIWNSINLPPGLYFASIKSDFNESKIISK